MAAQKSPGNVVPMVAPVTGALPGVTMGVIVAVDGEGAPIVEAPGVAAASARLLVAVDAGAIARAIEARTPVALLFEAGDPARPLLVGLIQLVQAVQPVQAPGTEARVDGKKVVLTGEEEIELRCGEASISLKKNGRLVIRGAYVETRAKGTNRIKGGSVQIN